MPCWRCVRGGGGEYTQMHICIQRLKAQHAATMPTARGEASIKIRRYTTIKNLENFNTTLYILVFLVRN